MHLFGGKQDGHSARGRGSGTGTCCQIRNQLLGVFSQGRD